MHPRPFPHPPKDLTRLLLLPLVLMPLTLLFLHLPRPIPQPLQIPTPLLPLPLNPIVLPPPTVIRIPLRPRHAHLQVLPTHIHTHKVILRVVGEKTLVDSISGGAGDGGCAKAPEGEESGFVGDVGRGGGEDVGFAAGEAVGCVGWKRMGGRGQGHDIGVNVWMIK